MLTPSLLSLFATGILLFITIIIVINNYNEFPRLYEKVIILLLIIIGIGIHGLIHLGVEKEYNYNPIEWIRVKIPSLRSVI